MAQLMLIRSSVCLSVGHAASYERPLLSHSVSVISVCLHLLFDGSCGLSRRKTHQRSKVRNCRFALQLASQLAYRLSVSLWHWCIMCVFVVWVVVVRKRRFFTVFRRWISESFIDNVQGYASYVCVSYSFFYIHCIALNGLFCADVQLRNYSLTLHTLCLEKSNP